MQWRARRARRVARHRGGRLPGAAADRRHPAHPLTFPPDCAARFELIRPIASGGFGEVFLARQKGLERQAVVKLLRLGDEDAARRFWMEARATAAIRHENVVRVLDSGAEATPWIAYEFCDGEVLRDRLGRGRMPVAEVLAAVAQVAAALDAAHAEGVLHRDVKPDNVLSTADGTWKLADFGIAKWQESTTFQTAAGTVLGTPAYMAPELVSGEQAVAATDVYALGVLFYEALVGEVPFRADHPVLTFEMHLRTPAPRVQAHGVSAPVEALVASCLAKSPDARPSAAQLKAALEAQLADAGGALSVSRHAVVKPAARPSRAAQATLAVRGGGGDTVRLEQAGTRARALERTRGLRAGLAAGLALACLAAVAVVALMPRGKPPRAAAPATGFPFQAFTGEVEAGLAARTRLRSAPIVEEQERLVNLAAESFDASPAEWRPRLEKQLALVREVFDALGVPLRRVSSTADPVTALLPQAVAGQLYVIATARARAWAMLGALTPLRRFASLQPAATRNRIAYTVLAHPPGADREGLEVLADVAAWARLVFEGIARDGVGEGVDVAHRLDELHDAAAVFTLLPWDAPLRPPFRTAAMQLRRQLAALPDPKGTGLPQAAADVWLAGLRGPAGATPEVDAALRRVAAAFPEQAARITRTAEAWRKARAAHDALVAELEPEVAKAAGMLSMEFSVERAAENTLPLQRMPRAALILARHAADGWSDDPRVARLAYEACAVYATMVVRRDAAARLTEPDIPLAHLAAQVYVAAQRAAARAFVHLLRLHAQGKSGGAPSFPADAFAFAFDSAMMLRGRPLPVSDQDILALATLRQDRLNDLPSSPPGVALAALDRGMWRMAFVADAGARDNWRTVHAQAREAFTSPTDRAALAKFEAEVERQLSKK